MTIKRALSWAGGGHLKLKGIKGMHFHPIHMILWKFLLNMPRFVVLGNKGSSMDILVLEHVVL